VTDETPRTPSEPTLFDRVGGMDGIGTLIQHFYHAILSDPELGPFFDGASMDRIRRMQVELFSAALGGPVQYSGRPLIHAHQHLHLERTHLQRFVDHLMDTLKGFELSDDERYDIITRINLYADDVLGSAAGYG